MPSDQELLDSVIQDRATLPAPDPAHDPFPYTVYWLKAIACVLLSGRVKPKLDGDPNRIDSVRFCKRANFHPHLFEHGARFLLRSRVVDAVTKRSEETSYQPGAEIHHRSLRDSA